MTRNLRERPRDGGPEEAPDVLGMKDPDGSGAPSGGDMEGAAGAGESGAEPPAATGSEGPRSPVEVAVGEGRDPRWEELLALAEQVGPAPELAHLDDAGLERQLRVGASRLAAETCRWLGLLAELVVRGVWADQGAKTPAVWLSWALSIAPATARDQVRVALRLRELDLVREQFAAGRISYSKVRAITRVAVPELEQMLLEWADQSTAAELEAAVRGFRRAQAGLTVDAEESERRKGVWLVDRGDGTADVVLRLPVDEAHVAYAAAQRLADLEQAAERDEQGVEITEQDAEQAGQNAEVAEQGGEAAERAAADVVVVPGGEAAPGAATPGAATSGVATPGAATSGVATSGVATSGEGPLVGGRAASAETADASMGEAFRVEPMRPPGARMAEAVVAALTSAVAAGPADTSGEDRHTLVVHVTEDDLAEPDGLPIAVEASTGTVPALSRRVLRRMACDAGVVFVSTDADGAPVDVGRRDRRLSAALRRAVRLRDRHCRFPGCEARRQLHAHHVIHWTDGGPTDLANLVLLCGFHHRHVHAHDYWIEVDPAGAHTFRRQDGRRVPRARRLPGTAGLGTDGPWAYDPWAYTSGGDYSMSREGGVLGDCGGDAGEGSTHGGETRQDAPGYPPDALQPSYWDGYFNLETTVAVLQQQFHAVLPSAALAA